MALVDILFVKNTTLSPNILQNEWPDIFGLCRRAEITCKWASGEKGGFVSGDNILLQVLLQK